MFSLINFDLKLKHKFPKKEKLIHKKRFDFLFSEGKSLKSHPIQAIYLSLEMPCFADFQVFSHSEVAFAVPKRHFKKAVDRNKIKRRMREAFRLNKRKLKGNFIIIFIYKSCSYSDYIMVEKSIIHLLEKINEKALS